jgi:hypothetical protein
MSSSAVFDQTYYLTNNADVVVAISQGNFANALDHYNQFGGKELRQPNALFNPNYYAINNADVLNAVSSGGFANVFAHYAEFGETENRAPATTYASFDAAGYLAANTDVAGAVTAGSFSSALDHYISFGQAESRTGSGITETVDANPGQTFTFTTAFDSFTGTANNDTFVGLQANGGATETLSAFDALDGGAGTDSLTITNSAAAAYNGPDITNIETVSYRATIGGAGLDFDEIAGATTVTLTGTTGITNFSDVLPTQNLTIKDSASSLDTTITYKASTVTSATDTATVTLDGAGQNAEDIQFAGDVETLTLVTSGDATRLQELILDAQTTSLNINAGVSTRVDTTFTATGTTTVTATGAGAVRLDATPSAMTTYNAADATGAQTITLNNATNATITGGSANDSFSFAATLNRSDTIDGGAGTDTITVTPTANVSGDLAITNVETIRIGDVANSVIVDLDNVAGVTTIRQSMGTASNVTTIRDVAVTATTVDFIGTGVVSGNLAADAIVMDYDSTTDVALTTVNLNNGGVATSGDITVQTGSAFNGADAVTITAADWGTGTGDAVTLGTVTMSKANTVTINSNTDVSLTIAGIGGAAATDRLTTVDMSGSDAGITLTITSDDDSDVTLGDGADTFTGGAGDETISGGTGADIIDAQAGNDTITLGGGIDTVRVNFGGEGTDTISDYAAGAGGDVFDFLGTSDVANSVTNKTSFSIQANANNTATQLVNGLTIIDNNDGANVSAASLSTTDVATYLADTDGAGVGTDAIVSDNGGITDDVYVIVSDGVDSALFFAENDTNAAIASGELTLIATFQGISDAGTFVAANFNDFLG